MLEEDKRTHEPSEEPVMIDSSDDSPYGTSDDTTMEKELDNTARDNVYLGEIKIEDHPGYVNVS